MKKLITLLICLGLVTFSATAQDAERGSDESSFGIGPRLGFYKAQDADEGNFYGGLQARIRLGPVVGLEGSVEYQTGQEYGFADYNVNTSFVPVTTSLMIFAPVSENIAPYGLAGIGAYYTIYDYSADDLGFDDSSFNLGYHLGFGAEFPFNRNVALNLDYRYIFLNPDDNDEAFDDATLSGNAFTAGLMFYF